MRKNYIKPTIIGNEIITNKIIATSGIVIEGTDQNLGKIDLCVTVGQNQDITNENIDSFLTSTDSDGNIYGCFWYFVDGDDSDGVCDLQQIINAVGRESQCNGNAIQQTGVRVTRKMVNNKKYYYFTTDCTPSMGFPGGGGVSCD